MKREKNLAKNTIIIALGKVCTQMITFFLLPLYTGVLSTSEYGIVDLLNTLIGLLLPIITFQVEQGIFRELIEVRENESEKKKIISSGVISVIIQCTLYLIIFIFISNLIDNKYKIFLATNVIVYIFLSLFQQIARGVGNNTIFAIGSFISALSTIILNIIFLLIVKLGATGMLLGTMFGQLIAITYYYFSLRLYNYINIKEYRTDMIKKLWKYSIPLIPNAISWWIFNASDRVIVSSVLGVDQNGILAASLKFSIVYTTFYSIFSMSWTESISVAINDKDIKEYFNKMFNVILKLFISLGLGIIVCMPIIFPIMINEKYITGYGLVPISIIATLFNIISGLIGVVYVAERNTKAAANTSILSALINIIVHLLLIKVIGLYAAVLSTFIANFIMSIYRFIDIKKRYFRIEVEKSLIYKSLAIVLLTLMTYYINYIYLNLLMFILVVFFTLNINHESLEFILKMMKKRNNKEL